MNKLKLAVLQLILCVLTLTALGSASAHHQFCQLNSSCPDSERCRDNLCVEVPPVYCLVDTGCACEKNVDCYIELGTFVEQNVPGGVCRSGTCQTQVCSTDGDCALGELCQENVRCVVDVDADRDRDGVPDGSENHPRDNCPSEPNANQADVDRDAIGDACDEDNDNDQLPDWADNCPLAANPEQGDFDGNGVGDACEPDGDGDGVPDDRDNCLPGNPIGLAANPDQRDSDGDGIGDACEFDDDGDGVWDADDPCPKTTNIACYSDRDGDGLADAVDPFPSANEPPDSNRPVDVIETGPRPPIGSLPFTPGNESPAPIGFTNEIQENSSPAYLGLVLVSDPDEEQSHAFAITSGNASGLFRIDGAGEVHTTAALDYETASQHVLEITVTDSGSLTGVAQVTANVVDINEPPVASNLAIDLEENLPSTPLGFINATDPDLNDALGFWITGGNGDQLFWVDRDTGALLTTGPLDYEQQSQHKLSITVRDSAGLADTSTTIIDVLDVDEGQGANAYLADLVFSAFSSGPFDPDKFDYSVTVPNAVASTTVTAKSQDPDASITVNGKAVPSGSPSAAISLQVGINVIAVAVTAEDGQTINTYSVEVTREAPLPGANADLDSLTLSAGTLVPAFNAATNAYTATVDHLVSVVVVSASAEDPAAAVNVNGTGSGSASVPLAVGENPVSITVTAEDGSTTRTYTCTIIRESATELAQRAYLKASNAGAGDKFGYAVALSGDTLVVGAPEEGDTSPGGGGAQSGAAYVFVRSDGVWTERAYLKASNAEAGDRFGSAVTVWGDTLAVSATYEDSASGGNQGNNSVASSGAVYLFTRDGSGQWSQQAYLKASNPGATDFFGRSISLYNTTLAVGAHFEDSNGNPADNSLNNAGAVYVFSHDGAAWTQQAYLKPSNAGANDWFGYALALHQDTLVVGAYGEDSSAFWGEGDDSQANAGAAYVFRRNGSSWSQEAFLKASNDQAGDFFGLSVAVSGDTVVVGAPQEDNTGNSHSDSGAAYVFAFDGSNWAEQAYLKASNIGAGDWFGRIVAVDGQILVVSAPNEDTTAGNSGAVYVYSGLGGSWSEKIMLKASNAGSDDLLGHTLGLSLSGDTIAAGAEWEDSTATGGELNNSANAAGAVYIYR